MIWPVWPDPLSQNVYDFVPYVYKNACNSIERGEFCGFLFILKNDQNIHIAQNVYTSGHTGFGLWRPSKKEEGLLPFSGLDIEDQKCANKFFFVIITKNG